MHGGISGMRSEPISGGQFFQGKWLQLNSAMLAPSPRNSGRDWFAMTASTQTNSKTNPKGRRRLCMDEQRRGLIETIERMIIKSSGSSQ